MTIHRIWYISIGKMPQRKATEYIDSDNVFWFDWVAYVVYKTESKNISLNNGGYITLLHNSIDSPNQD